MIINYKGDLPVRTNSSKTLKISDVYVTDQIEDNLLSKAQVTKGDVVTMFHEKFCEVFNIRTGETLFTGYRDGSFWKFDLELSNSENSKILETGRLKDHTYSVEPEEPVGSEGVQEQTERIGQEGVVEQEVEVREPERPTTSTQDGTQQEVFTVQLKSTGIQTCRPINVERREGWLWHCRMRHASVQYLRESSRTYKKLRKVKFDDRIRDCRVCHLSKIKKSPHQKVRDKAPNPFDVIHSNLMGPIHPIGGIMATKYIVTFMDDVTRFARAYPIANKTRLFIIRLHADTS